MVRVVAAELRVAVTLYAAPLKGVHYAHILPKATAIGAVR